MALLTIKINPVSKSERLSYKAPGEWIAAIRSARKLVITRTRTYVFFFILSVA